MRIRYFAGAADAAGCEEQQLDGPAMLADLRTRLGNEHGPEFVRILSYCSLLVDGTRHSGTEIVPDAATVDVLPPFAGG